jgi:hypothetical protein
MKYYILKAKRCDVRMVTWFSTSEFLEKRESLLMETIICNSFKHLAVDGLREWFYGGSEVYGSVIKKYEDTRTFISKINTPNDSWGWWSKSGRIVG